MATCSTFLSLDLLFDPSTVSSCYHYLSSSLPIYRHPFATCTQHNADPDLYPASTLLTFAFAKMSFGGYPFFPGMGNQGYYDYCQGQGYDPGYGYGYNNMPEGAIRPRDPNEPYDVHSEWIGDMPLAEWQDQQDHYYQ